MSFEIKQETPISMADLKVELEKVAKRDTELNFRAAKTDEYLKQFNKADPKKVEELIKKITKLAVPRLKDQHIYKIVDLMPKTIDSLKAALSGYGITINNENLKKIVDLVLEYSD
jgi:DNA-directed RNA polymerase subunit F